MGDEESKVADTHVEKNDDGSYTATVIKEDESTSEGTSTDGILSDASAQEAIDNANS